MYIITCIMHINIYNQIQHIVPDSYFAKANIFLDNLIYKQQILKQYYIRIIYFKHL